MNDQAKLRLIIAVVLLWVLGMRHACAYTLLPDDSAPPTNSSFKLLDVDRLDMEYRKVMVYRDPYYAADDQDFSYGAAVLFDFRIARYGYWRNNVHMLSTPRQVRAVGWEYECGVNASKYMDLFYYHHSQHMLERDPGELHYPLVNEYGVRLHFLTK